MVGDHSGEINAPFLAYFKICFVHIGEFATGNKGGKNLLCVGCRYSVKTEANSKDIAAWHCQAYARSIETEDGQILVKLSGEHTHEPQR